MATTTNVTRVIVRTNDGREQETSVENYSARAIAEELNNGSSNVVAIGDLVIQRAYVTGVRPVPADTTATA